MWLSVWSKVQIVCITTTATASENSTISCLIYVQTGFNVYRLTQVVLEKRPLNGCSRPSRPRPSGSSSKKITSGKPYYRKMDS